MKKIYYSPMRHGSVSFQLLLDDAVDFVARSAENVVLFITCRSELLPCNTNLFSSKAKCFECIAHSKFIETKVKHPRIKFINLGKLKSRKKKNALPDFNYNTLDDIKKINYKSIPIGLGIVSSFVSATRNINPELNRSNQNIFDSLLNTSIYIVDSFLEIFEDTDPSEVVLFNGRFAGLRDVFELCLQKKIKVTTVEFLLTKDDLNVSRVVFENSLPHDTAYNTQIMNDLWSNREIDDRERIGHEFFIRRRQGKFSGDKVFTGRQNEGLMPETWDSSKRNFVIFNSSEDEIFSIGGEWETRRVFESQEVGIKYIFKKLANSKDINIYLRMHPNLSDIKFTYAKELLGLNGDNCFIIDPSAPISSYDLMDNAEKCIVFGSTAGVEAAYWGKPVINLANSFYNDLDVVYSPVDREEFDQLLIKKIECKPKLGCLKYGLWALYDRGERHKHINFNFTKTNLFTKEIRVSESLRVFNSFLVYKIIFCLTRLINLPGKFRKRSARKEGSK